MTPNEIRCSVIENSGCPVAKGDYILGGTTPAGMCIKAYGAVSTFAHAMRFSKQIPLGK